MLQVTHAELWTRWESEPHLHEPAEAPAWVFTADQVRITVAPQCPSQRRRGPHRLLQRGTVSTWPGGTASLWRRGS